MPSRPPTLRIKPRAQRKAWAGTERTKRVRGRAGVEQRHRFLAEHPLCVECEKEGKTAAAVIVDHVIPLAEGGADDDGNKQGLCVPHDKAKSAAEAARGRARGRVKSQGRSAGHR